MNTTAIEMPRFGVASWDRLLGLYNGFAYVLAIGLLMNTWEGLQNGIPHLLAGDPLAFLRGLVIAQWHGLWQDAPGPLLIPPIVNLAPRTGWRRIVLLAVTVVFLWWWCLGVADGVHFGWSWHSLGSVLDGCLSAGMIMGVCVYHIDGRAAADVLMRTKIQRAGLDAELQRAHLRLLRAQIEPHFLFNTLSVVRALGRSDREGTVGMLDNLVRYFDAATPRLRESEVPLERELQLIEAYLAIYRARMGSRLAYQIDRQEDLAQIRIPTMILLTLVENALKHGVGPAVAGGFIRVSAARERDALLLKVADSGRGMDLRLGHGMGLANIRQRLQMMYGRDAVLTLRPAEPRGVVASVLLPLQRRS
jgi:hypothetical protein